MNIAERVVLGVIAAVAIALMAKAMRALTWSGAAATMLVGSLSFAFGGAAVAIALVVFFATGSALGRLHNVTADRARSVAAKGATRDALQVFANGGVATLCAIAGGVAASSGAPAAGTWVSAAVCALAAASGDTWSTEIGAFSPSAPRRITDLHPATPGASGAVTLLGTAAAPLGGLLVGAAGLVRSDIMAAGSWLAAGAVAGGVGSLVDSVLGATLQGQWCCTVCGRVSDAPDHPGCDKPAHLCRGFAWLNNDAVNLAATLTGALVGLGAAFFAGRA